MNIVKIIATITVQAAYCEELLTVFQQLLKASRQESGNLRYDLHQVKNNAQQFVFIETWASEEAVQAHNASPHFATFLQAIDGKTETVDIVLLNNLSDNTH